MKFTDKFNDSDIDWRVSSQGMGGNGPWAIVVPYLTARAVMERLDAVVGAEHWFDEYTVGDGFVQCTLTIVTKERNRVYKTDAAEMTKIEPVKGGFSDAFKRAAVKWGIGRYLYDTPKTYAKFVDKSTPGALFTKIDGQGFYWVPDVKGPSVGQVTSVSDSKMTVNNTVNNTMTRDDDPVPVEVPNYAPGADTPTDSNEDYVVKFGKFKGKSLKDIKPGDLDGYVRWIEGRGGDMKPNVAEFVTVAKQFMGFVPEPNFDEEIPF
jgi:hypothetical protein